MPWRVEYHPDQMIVEVVYWGETNGIDIHEGTIEAIKAVKKQQATRGLVDCREQTSTATIADLFDLPDLYDDEGLSRDIRIAFVEPAMPELREMADFYDNVCVNRGWRLRRFAARDSAIAWLESG